MNTGALGRQTRWGDSVPGHVCKVQKVNQETPSISLWLVRHSPNPCSTALGLEWVSGSARSCTTDLDLC